MVKKTKDGFRKRYRDSYRLVVLRLCGKHLDPDKITKSLGLKPISAQPSEDLKRNNRKIYDTKYGHWNLGSRLRSNATLQNQAKDILDQIRPKKKVLRQILKDNVEADLNIAVEPHKDLVIAAYTFPAQVISEFTSLGIDIRFSVHIPSNLA